MGNAIALVVQPIAKALSVNAHSDENLIKAIAAGDEGAMRTLYARHNVRVFRFISRLVTEPGTAEDLVSEVFIDVWTQAAVGVAPPPPPRCRARRGRHGIDRG